MTTTKTVKPDNRLKALNKAYKDWIVQPTANHIRERLIVAMIEYEIQARLEKSIGV